MSKAYESVSMSSENALRVTMEEHVKRNGKAQSMGHKEIQHYESK